MSQKINIVTFGNQVIQASLQNVPLSFDFQWDGRNNRYMVAIANVNTGGFAAAQSVEPYSALDIYDIGLGDFYLIPIMNNPDYLITGEIDYDFEDLGTKLIIALFSPDEIPSLYIYAPITTL